MTESRPSSGSEDRPPRANERGLVNIVYILYLASLIFGVTVLIGVVIAYVNQRDAPAWLGSHTNGVNF